MELVDIVALLIIAEVSKEPEYRCAICSRVYKQETRYNTHITHAHLSGCIKNDTQVVVTATANDGVIMEILRQNRDMLDMLKQQQETINLLLRRNMIA